AASGIGALASNDVGMAVFIAGLALIVLGTGHFKPIMPVMIDKLYAPDDPRRDAAFNIFYIGINVGAAFGPLACSVLGEKVGWDIPAGWFQSLNAFMVVALAPLFGMMWSSLGRQHRNPGQPMKLALGLYLLAVGYVFMVAGSIGTTPTVRASMFWLTMTYLLH